MGSAGYSEYTIFLISFRRFSDVLPAFPCASSLGNLPSNCSGGKNLIPFSWPGCCKISIFIGVVTMLNDFDDLYGVWF